MRAFLALVLLPWVLLSCTPYIPVKDDFGTSALTPTPGIPPEYAEFNNFDPNVNPLLAEQICATPYEPLDSKSISVSTGEMAQMRGRCRTHVPLFGP